MPGASAASAAWQRKPDRDGGRSRTGGDGGTGGRRNLLLRVAAAVVLAPAALAIAYAGEWLWAALVTLASIRLYDEWLMIVGTAPSAARSYPVVSRWLFRGSVSHSDGSMPRSSVLALGGAAVAGLSQQRKLWTAAGFFYAAAAEVASVLVRLDQVWGVVALFLILLVVWVTDIGAFSPAAASADRNCGRGVSPKKTWAGAIGGFAGRSCGCLWLLRHRLCQGGTAPGAEMGAGFCCWAPRFRSPPSLADLFESAVNDAGSASRIPAS